MDQMSIMAEIERSPIVITVNPDISEYGDKQVRVNVYGKGAVDRKTLAALLREQADAFDADEVNADV